MVLVTDDEHLVAAAQAGDLLAFADLVRRHETSVYRVALRMLADPQEAEDATQDTFVQAWQALPRFRRESAVSTWLYRIVTNRCLNLLRSRPRLEHLDESHEARTAGPHRLAETRAELDALKLAIARLTPEQRAPLVLRELEGLSYADIAHVLETTVPAVKGGLHRARLELLQSLRAWR